MSVIIRFLTLTDEPFLWEMLYQALYVAPRQMPFVREVIYEPEISRYVIGWGKPDDAGIVANDEDQRVGAAWFRLLVGDNRGYGYVDEMTPELSLAVLPAYRGQGIGSRLLAGLLDIARPHYAGICLSVDADNPAVKLYRRFGFEIARSHQASLTMVKRWTPM
jgi:ribosomal protein S18 acetylase RimI-like enzyme